MLARRLRLIAEYLSDVAEGNIKGNASIIYHVQVCFTLLPHAAAACAAAACAAAATVAYAAAAGYAAAAAGYAAAAAAGYAAG